MIQQSLECFLLHWKQKLNRCYTRPDELSVRTGKNDAISTSAGNKMAVCVYEQAVIKYINPSVKTLVTRSCNFQQAVKLLRR